jgi:hypothetical protein
MARNHLVVDGSNIATEGRDRPSLRQLDEAVRSMLELHPYKHLTVVVDATFGHRIDPKERKAFEHAVVNNELVTPPAGAVGRGDRFVLEIANRANADVLSNDSFQEFHGVYPWLFDEGRLYGGKPVADVGWIFVPRLPVRGPASRKSVRAAKKTAATPAPAAEVVVTADEVTAPTPKGASRSPAAAGRSRRASVSPTRAEDRHAGRAKPRAREPINEPLAYTAFVIDHPLGSLVDGEVQRFTSHGAYIGVAGARGYVPLKGLGDPPPRSSREVLKLGETRPFVVDRFDPERRGIDLVLADAVSTKADSGLAAKAAAPAAEFTPPTAEEALVSPAAKKTARKAAPAARKTTARKASTKATGTARKATAKRAPAKKTTARKTTARKAPARKAPAKKAPAKKATASKTTARKTTARKATTARKTTAKRAPAKKTTAGKTTARKAPARKTAARKAPARKTAAKKGR